jgi:hypothetical protein
MAARKPLKMAMPLAFAMTSLGILPLSGSRLISTSCVIVGLGVHTDETLEDAGCLVALLVDRGRLEETHVGNFE